MARNAKRRSLLIVALVAGGSLIPPTAVWFMWSDWVPPSTIDHLPGASPTQVTELLGKPEDTFAGAGYERWYYRRPGRWAEFRVDFYDGRAEHWSYDR